MVSGIWGVNQQVRASPSSLLSLSLSFPTPSPYLSKCVCLLCVKRPYQQPQFSSNGYLHHPNVLKYQQLGSKDTKKKVSEQIITDNKEAISQREWWLKGIRMQGTAPEGTILAKNDMLRITLDQHTHRCSLSKLIREASTAAHKCKDNRNIPMSWLLDFFFLKNIAGTSKKSG